MLKNMISSFSAFRQKKFFKYGLPFLLFMLLGSFGLEKFASLRYEFRRNQLLDEKNLAKLGIKKKKVTLEEEYEKLKQLDIDSWENVRGPRPWEQPQQPQQKAQ